MTTGTEEFGPDESGALAATPGAAPGGGPEAAPWLAGGSVGYAEAMFGSPDQEAAAGPGASGGRRRAAEPGAGQAPAFLDRQGFEHAPGHPGFAGAGPQGVAFDAPTAEFFPGPMFEQPGFDQPAYEVGEFGQSGPGQGGFEGPGFGSGEYERPGYDSGSFDRQTFEPDGVGPVGFDAEGYVAHAAQSAGAPRIPAQPQRAVAPNPAEAVPTGAAQDRGAWSAAPPQRAPRRDPAGPREGSGLPSRPMPPQNQIPHTAQPAQVPGGTANLRGPVHVSDVPQQPGRPQSSVPGAAGMGSPAQALRHDAPPYPDAAAEHVHEPVHHPGQHHAGPVQAPAAPPYPAAPLAGADELSRSGRSHTVQRPVDPAQVPQQDMGQQAVQPMSPMMTPQYGTGALPTRPSVPDAPVPAPEPLPVRGGARGEAEQPAARQAPAARAQAPQADAPSPAAARTQAAGRPAETLTPPRRTPAQRRQTAPAPEVAAPAAGPAVAAPEAAPVAPAPAAAAVAAPAATGSMVGGEDLSRERLRSVAPVPAPRESAASGDARRGGFSALVAQPDAETAPGPAPQAAPDQAVDAESESDEMVVPWQALSAPVDHLAESRSAAAQQATAARTGGFAPEQAVPVARAAQEAPASAAPDVAAEEAAPNPRVAGPRVPAAQGSAVSEAQQAPAQPIAAAAVQEAAPQQATAGVGRQQAEQVPAEAPAQRPTVAAPRGGRRRAAESDEALQPVQSVAAAGHDEERAPGYDLEALEAVYRVIHERRDVRNNFLSDDVPVDVLTRILEAAHTAPSVGFSQPWDFLVIRDAGMRQSIHELAVRQRRAYAASLPKARAKAFATMKVEAILETPVNIVVTCDPTRGGRHTLGRYTQAMMAPFSSCLAVENLWLAARAEGLGVGWVSFFDEPELAAVLDLPAHLQVVAYLCVGYVSEFPAEPELAGTGWAKRRPLAWAVHEERFGHRALPGTEPLSLLSETIDAIRPLDPQAAAAARSRQARMTKPPGSLGALEAVAEQLAGLSGVCPPPMPEPAALAVFAGDHGVHAQGVTPWPQEVTAQMVGNFLAGGAVVNAFAKQVGAEVCVVDVGVAAQLVGGAGLVPRKIRFGTADMTQGPALTRAEAVEAVEAGIETARDLVAAGNRCLLTGDMGIANTTASAALIAAFTGASAAQVTGYGTGIDEQTYAHKVDVVSRALQLHRPDPQDPIGVLAAFGGLEHAALAGFILGAAALRVPVILDGVIAGAAALVAQAFVPEATVACVAGHRSAEPGHALALEALGVTPLIDLELRLGEGSGAALALPLVGAAVRALREVATFDDAGVADASEHTAQPPTERDRA